MGLGHWLSPPLCWFLEGSQQRGSWNRTPLRVSAACSPWLPQPLLPSVLSQTGAPEQRREEAPALPEGLDVEGEGRPSEQGHLPGVTALPRMAMQVLGGTGHANTQTQAFSISPFISGLSPRLLWVAGASRSTRESGPAGPSGAARGRRLLTGS